MRIFIQSLHSYNTSHATNRPGTESGRKKTGRDEQAGRELLKQERMRQLKGTGKGNETIRARNSKETTYTLQRDQKDMEM